jgi:hypothetical protein
LNLANRGDPQVNNVLLCGKPHTNYKLTFLVSEELVNTGGEPDFRNSALSSSFTSFQLKITMKIKLVMKTMMIMIRMMINKVMLMIMMIKEKINYFYYDEAGIHDNNYDG